MVVHATRSELTRSPEGPTCGYRGIVGMPMLALSSSAEARVAPGRQAPLTEAPLLGGDRALP